jgi:uncharacterized protein (DUF488 family)
LKRHDITAIADVRSEPYSRFHAQFNREVIAGLLTKAGVAYVFLGRELGARRAERECYVDRQARYSLITELPAFQDGLSRVQRGMTAQRIALMCAEKDPITCHRTILVCRALRSDDLNIQHVLADGSIETSEQAETRLLEEVGLPPGDLFRDRRELVEEAYDRQARRIAYVEPESEPQVAEHYT